MNKPDLKPGTYKHYKGNLYRVHGVARHSETLEWLVYYEALYPNTHSQTWVRPYEMFIEQVEVNGKRMPRFELIEPDSEDELLWLVDEQDKPIGTIYKLIAHSNPVYIHREVACLIVDKQNKILFQKRSLNKKIMPGLWGLTAGHVTYPQTYDFAMQRELKEETGLELKLKLVEYYLHQTKIESHINAWYVAFYNGENIDFDTREVSEVAFWDKTEFERRVAAGETTDTMLQNHICERFWAGKFENIIKNY